MELLETLRLEQHVTQPTHRDGHILDLTITCISEKLIDGPPLVGQFISDHAAVSCRLALTRPGLSVKTINYRKIKSIDSDSLRQDLQSTALCMDKQLVTADDLDAYVCVRILYHSFSTP